MAQRKFMARSRATAERRCEVPGCGQPGRLYPCGVRCERDSPAAMQRRAAEQPDTVAVPGGGVAA